MRKRPFLSDLVDRIECGIGFQTGVFFSPQVVLPACLASVRTISRPADELDRFFFKNRYFCIISLIVINYTGFFFYKFIFLELRGLTGIE